ncbi:hypothetical protein L6452_33934 [Arctium lappa]|uniref:Uncharacterized protein n=1 Tax=Arctium lappa TaxID=4217 RepID=A0ACB8YHD1_ARCLA|nr:hypothetical protein L6452_33934 [Arctium lappa]
MPPLTVATLFLFPSPLLSYVLLFLPTLSSSLLLSFSSHCRRHYSHLHQEISNGNGSDIDSMTNISDALECREY